MRMRMTLGRVGAGGAAREGRGKRRNRENTEHPMLNIQRRSGGVMGWCLSCVWDVGRRQGAGPCRGLGYAGVEKRKCERGGVGEFIWIGNGKDDRWERSGELESRHVS